MAKGLAINLRIPAVAAAIGSGSNAIHGVLQATKPVGFIGKTKPYRSHLSIVGFYFWIGRALGKFQADFGLLPANVLVERHKGPSFTPVGEGGSATLD